MIKFSKIIVLFILILACTACNQNNKQYIYDDTKEHAQDDVKENSVVSSNIENQKEETAQNNKATKEIVDLDNWNHPTKKVFNDLGIDLYKVEIANQTYPIFYTNEENEDLIVGYDFLNELAKANGFWDFSIIKSFENQEVKVKCDKESKHVVSSDDGKNKIVYYPYYKETLDKTYKLIVNKLGWKSLKKGKDSDDYYGIDINGNDTGYFITFEGFKEGYDVFAKRRTSDTFSEEWIYVDLNKWEISFHDNWGN